MPDTRTLSLALPVAFLLHVAEEAPSFVAWFNRRVTPQISQESFLTVNFTAFVVTVAVALSLLASRARPTALVAVAWVGFLMLANGLFHLVATIADGAYCPGVVTSVLIYLPLSLLFIARVAGEARIPPAAVAAAALGGAVPMAVHGYLIVFRGSRLL
jgi:hypothetical protein